MMVVKVITPEQCEQFFFLNQIHKRRNILKMLREKIPFLIKSFACREGKTTIHKPKIRSTDC